MKTKWREEFSGIYISSKSYQVRPFQQSESESMVHALFEKEAAWDLERIASEAIGRDLLTLISKHYQRHREGFPRQHLDPGHRPRCIIAHGHSEFFDGLEEKTRNEDYYRNTATLYKNREQEKDWRHKGSTLKMKMAPDREEDGTIVEWFDLVSDYRIQVPGRPHETIVTCSPFANYTSITVPRFGVPTPSFIALAHELIHVLHDITGNGIYIEGDPAAADTLEEQRTIGLGRYTKARISENAIREEHGLPLRTGVRRRDDSPPDFGL